MCVYMIYHIMCDSIVDYKTFYNILDYSSYVLECVLVAAVYTNESCHTCVYTCMCLMRMCDSILDYKSLYNILGDRSGF